MRDVALNPLLNSCQMFLLASLVPLYQHRQTSCTDAQHDDYSLDMSPRIVFIIQRVKCDSSIFACSVFKAKLRYLRITFVILFALNVPTAARRCRFSSLCGVDLAQSRNFDFLFAFRSSERPQERAALVAPVGRKYRLFSL